MLLYNTPRKSVETFTPLSPPLVTLYSCGPTVYDYTHIGHMRTYCAIDILKRALTYFNYHVKHVMNITDVGHLTDDADRGEDKLEKMALSQKKSVWDVARFFTKHFFSSTDLLDIIRPDIVCRATDHIPEMIALITQLSQKGYTYETEEAVYFYSQKFKNYGQLTGQSHDEKKVGARDEVVVDPYKKNPTDFVLWFKRVGKFQNHTMHWSSPWGDGFPGWHIECSAMSMKYLGETIDIHAGGIDHIPVHHTNEIAQSEGATGKQFVRTWFHAGFLMVDGRKMSKSLNNFYTIDEIKKRGFDPLALRYLFLQSHYRSTLNFTWGSIEAAANGYRSLRDTVHALKKQTERVSISQEKLSRLDDLRNRFAKAVSQDLQLPEACAVVWEIIKSNIPSRDKYDLILECDTVLGLGLSDITDEVIPDEVLALAQAREKARQKKDFTISDQLRRKIEEKGYSIEDTDETYVLKKTSVFS